MTSQIPGAGLLAGKTAIITGTAMGLGKAMARVFVREGAKVLAADIDGSNEQSLADLGPDCIPFHADVSKEEDVKAMFAKARELFGRVDIAVNNAGTIAVGGVTDLSPESYNEFTQTNFLGAMLCTRHALETMVPDGGGVIINVTSVGSLNTEDRAPIIYSAAKAAVNSLTKAIAVNDPGFFGAGLIYNPERPHHVVRFGVCAVTLVVVSMISTYARSRGAGSVPAVWIAAGLLVGGVVGNWIAGAYWDAGVPDFISRGDRMWNLADFAIGMGMLLFLVSTLAYAIRAFAHDRKDRST